MTDGEFSVLTPAGIWIIVLALIVLPVSLCFIPGRRR